jgi:hypothetical protein
MSSTITNHIFMVRPANFGFNEETAASNAFQSNDTSRSLFQIHVAAITEFDAFVSKLQEKGINVTVAHDSQTPIKPDAIFPNNWVSFHEDGSVITYPMYAPVRRLERSEDILFKISTLFHIENRFNLETAEAENLFLEGTGSMIFDRPNQLVYACISPRTDETILDRFCDITGFDKVVFTAVDANGQQIYHTNVMMALGETFVVICMDTITDADERIVVEQSIVDTDKELIDITLEQMGQFAGNMLQVKNDIGDTYLVMSQTAYNSLTISQLSKIEAHTNILTIAIPTIEKYGGGSVRCMMAEMFLKPKIQVES